MPIYPGDKSSLYFRCFLARGGPSVGRGLVTEPCHQPPLPGYLQPSFLEQFLPRPRPPGSCQLLTLLWAVTSNNNNKHGAWLSWAQPNTDKNAEAELPDNNIYYSTQTGPSPAPLLGNPLWRARKGWTANTSCEWLTLTGVYLVTPVSQGEASYDESRKGGAGPGQWVLMVREQFVLITGHNGQSLTRDGAPHAHHQPSLVSLTPDPDQGRMTRITIRRPPVIEILSFKLFKNTFLCTLSSLSL